MLCIYIHPVDPTRPSSEAPERFIKKKQRKMDNSNLEEYGFGS